MIDRKKLKQEIHATVAHIRRLKAMRNESRQPRWDARPASELASLKCTATLLCAAAAAVRGRTHEIEMPRTFVLPPEFPPGQRVRTVVCCGRKLDAPGQSLAELALEYAERLLPQAVAA